LVVKLNSAHRLPLPLPLSSALKSNSECLPPLPPLPPLTPALPPALPPPLPPPLESAASRRRHLSRWKIRLSAQEYFFLRRGGEGAELSVGLEASLIVGSIG
jgi:hypothetical protein